MVRLLPILLRLELAEEDEDTPYSSARWIRFGGQHTNTSDVFCIADNEQEDRHSPPGNSKVMSVMPTALTTKNLRGSLSLNSEEARVSSSDRLTYEILTARKPKQYSLRYGHPPATFRFGGKDRHVVPFLLNK